MYISGFFPQVMQMYSLNRRIHQSNVTVNCLHPGVVDSEFTRSFRDDCHWTCLYRCAKCTGIYNIHFVNRMYFPYTQHKKSSLLSDYFPPEICQPMFMQHNQHVEPTISRNHISKFRHTHKKQAPYKLKIWWMT